MILAHYVIHRFFHDSMTPFSLLEYSFKLVDPKPKCQGLWVFWGRVVLDFKKAAHALVKETLFHFLVKF
jgi:hypothetical protein